jgi:hypothetical protein
MPQGPRFECRLLPARFSAELPASQIEVSKTLAGLRRYQQGFCVVRKDETPHFREERTNADFAAVSVVGQNLTFPIHQSSVGFEVSVDATPLDQAPEKMSPRL